MLCSKTTKKRSGRPEARRFPANDGDRSKRDRHIRGPRKEVHAKLSYPAHGQCADFWSFFQKETHHA